MPPLVATVVDVTGIVIYFAIAALLLLRTSREIFVSSAWLIAVIAKRAGRPRARCEGAGKVDEFNPPGREK